MKKITIAVKEPGKKWVKREVEDDLKTYQDIVGGYIEGFYAIAGDILLFCNEDGKFMDLKPNVLMPWGDMIVGTIFAVRCDEEGEFASLTDKDINKLSKGEWRK